MVRGPAGRGRVRLRGNRFSAVVPLRAGTNAVTASCGRGRDASVSKPLLFRVRLDERPTARIRVSVSGRTVTLDAVDSAKSEVRAAPLVDYRWRPADDNPARVRLPRAGRRVSLTAPRVDGEYYVSLRVVDARGRGDRSTVYFVVAHGRPRVANLRRGNAAWIEGAVVYGVIPHRFGRRGFQAVTAKLDYLRSLGVDALWLSPVNSTIPGDFGYSVTDYFGLRADYGTKRDFRSLVREAHRRGIRVLMDFVPNHTSNAHPYFDDAEQHGRASRYWHFYARDEEGNYAYYFDWPHLPNLNYENHEVRRMVTEAFSYWVREFDVDGFRVDVAWGITERRPGFWPAWRRELKRIKPDLLLLAEASARDTYYFTSGFDAAYDWTGQLGQWSWEHVFDDTAAIAPALDYALSNPPLGYDADALVFRFLNNNDTGERFVDRHGVPLTRVAAAVLLTLPGLPCVYTGDEVGARYLPYEEAVGGVPWNDPEGLRPHYRRLIALRHELPALRSRHVERVLLDVPHRLYGYVRYGTRGEPPVLVLVNFGSRAATAAVTLPPRFRALRRTGALEDALVRGRIAVAAEGALRVPMEPLSARVLVAA